MRPLIYKLIISVSLPIILGVGVVLAIFYKSLFNALFQWEQDSNIWIYSTQQQLLHNSVFSQHLIEEYSFNQMQLHMVIMKSLYNKYQNQKIIINQNTIFTICSYRELAFNQCPQNVYQQLNQNQFYADLYFVRQVFKFDLLTPQQQYFIIMNDFLSFYGRAAFYSSQISQSLLQIIFIYNADTTSVEYGIPSGFYNYTQSDFEDCFGNNYIEPFDPRCRPWYKYAQKHQGYFFYEPYIDAIMGNLLMTLSSQVMDSQQNFYSVDSIDFSMQSIVQQFNSTLNDDSYSVLLHEFNSTIFYHPLLQNSSLISWGDLEFQNMTINCQSSLELQNCLYEKEQFMQQVNESISYIQHGNYDIDGQINTTQMYQYWSRYGVKLISLVYPVKSTINGINTQLPYSFTTILTARVMKDNSDTLKLFNLFNENIIKIPLIIEFIIISISIFIFIFNYGYFLKHQIQHPIDLLIIFLQRSLMQQQSCNQILLKKEKCNLIRKSQQYQIKNTNSKLSNRKKGNNMDQDFQNQNQILDTPTPLLSSGNNGQIFNFLSLEEKKNDEQRMFTLLSKNNLLYPQNPEEEVLIGLNNIQDGEKVFQKSHTTSNQINTQKTLMHTSHNNRKINLQEQHIQNSPGQQFLLNQYESPQQITQSQRGSSPHQTKTLDESVFSLRQNSKSDGYDFINKLERAQHDDKENQILNGLKPMFLEMEIIKQTFLNLDNLINYQIDAYTQNSQDTMNTLFHFSKAKSTFQKLQNELGIGRCYFNLGVIYMLKSEYDLASEQFESALMINLRQIGVDTVEEINQNIFLTFDSEEDELTLFCKRIFSLAYCLKSQAFQSIYKQKEDINSNYAYDFSSYQEGFKVYNQQNKSLLRKSFDLYEIIQKIIFNQGKRFSDLFKLYLYQEQIEIVEYLNIFSKLPLYVQKSNFLLKKISKINYNTPMLSSSNRQHKDTDNRTRFSFDDSHHHKFNSFNKLNNNLMNIIIEILKSRQKFLLGQIESKKKNYPQAIEYLTQSLEEGTHYNPQQRKITLQNLNELFKLTSLNQYNIKAEIQSEEQNNPIDILILLQLDSILQLYTFETCIEYIKQSNFFKQGDRVMIIVFNTDLEVFMPFTEIKSENQWKFVIKSIQNLFRQYIQNPNQDQILLSWQDALNQSLNYIYEFKIWDSYLSNEFQKYYTNQSIFNYTQKDIINLIKKQKSQLERKKIVLLFSREQENWKQNTDQQFLIKQRILNLPKPIVYHMKDYQLIDIDQNPFKSECYIYESFQEEIQFVQKVNKLRNIEKFNQQYEYLAILNYS
ncbi:hypothetical protein ABPG74_009511 [Tetrahymena malaccensis]